MPTSKHESYALPDQLAPDLTAVLNYWQGLRRGENSMPFADDIDLAAVACVPQRGLLLEVFERTPFASGSTMRDKSCAAASVSRSRASSQDEIPSKSPLEELTAQASATVAGGVPTHYSDPSGSSRLLLPTWGEGHMSLLLGLVTSTNPH